MSIMPRTTYFSIGTAVLITGFLILAVVNLFFRTKYDNAIFISQDVEQLADIFEKIDTDCGIIDFDYQKNPINFLNTGSFSGSEVGPMNLAHPKKWQGPYLQDNLTIQDKEYQVVKTGRGYFIVPGDGVKLPNGLVVGEDLIFDENSDIAAMMHDENALLYNNYSLAAQLKKAYRVAPLASDI